MEARKKGLVTIARVTFDHSQNLGNLFTLEYLFAILARIIYTRENGTPRGLPSALRPVQADLVLEYE